MVQKIFRKRILRNEKSNVCDIALFYEAESLNKQSSSY